MSRDELLREHVLYLLRGGGVHIDFDSAIDGIPPELRGATIQGMPHSPWQLLEHMRICQWDILEYSRDPAHVSPSFPEGLWPVDHSPPTVNSWDESLAAFRKDQDEMTELVANTDIDLLAQLPHAKPGHTLLREALLIVDHNAYHIGQLIVVRRALGAWRDEHRQPGG